MAKKIRVWDGSAWQDVSVALPYNAVHSAQASMPSTAVDGQIWLDTDGTLSDTQYIPKTLTSTTGDIIYASSANTPARLGIGSTDQVLKVSGGIPVWGTAPSASHIGVRVKGSTNQSIANATTTTLTWNQETYDTHGFHDVSTNNSRLTVPSGYSGYYYIYSTINWNENTSGYRRTAFKKNGSTGIGEYDQATPLSIWYYIYYGTTAYLSAGDYIEHTVYQNSGGSRTIHMGETVGDLTHFGMFYLGA